MLKPLCGFQVGQTAQHPSQANKQTTKMTTIRVFKSILEWWIDLNQSLKSHQILFARQSSPSPARVFISAEIARPDTAYLALLTLACPPCLGLLAYLVCIALAFHGSTHRFETLVFLYLGLGLTRRQMMFPRLHRHSHFSRQSIKSRRRSITQEVYKEFTQIVMIFLS